MNAMAAALEEAPARAATGAILRAPFDGFSDARLLAHFRGRRGVAYFAVPDPEETRREKIDAILENRFEFNGETHVLRAPVEWTVNPSRDVEWHILLHKFYYAVGLGMAYEATGNRRYADKWIELVDSWISSTPIGFIAADVTGRRVQNWIYAYRHFVTHGRWTDIPPDFHRRFIDSLHAQVEFLCENLTPARNHRTLELYAIFLAGVVFPEIADAGRWREFALGEIVGNMQTDLLPDGVQCELSTDYHHLVLKNYLNVRRLASSNGIGVPEAMDACLLRALEFSLHAHKPDGIVPSFSDGDARGFLDLLMQGAELFGREDMRYVATAGARGSVPKERSRVFPDSGYVVLRSGWGEDGRAFQDEHYLMLDCGPLGAGNHGHFDCLSIELAAFGRSLIVDPGRYTYSEAGETNWRVRFRGTAAHNTVCVDGRNQTRYLPKAVKEASRHAIGSVRHKVSGPAPEATLARFATGPGFDFVHGIARSHEYDAVHERRILFVGDEYWVISDWLHGDTDHRYDLRFQLSELAEGRTSEAHSGETLRFLSPGLLIAHDAGEGACAAIDPGFVSCRYGEKRSAPVVRVTRHGRSAAFHSVLVPHRGDAPRVGVRPAALGGGIPVGDGGRPHAFVIDFDLDGRRWTDYVALAPGDEERTWDEAGVRFTGSFLFLRRSREGEPMRAHCDPGARFKVLT